MDKNYSISNQTDLPIIEKWIYRGDLVTVAKEANKSIGYVRKVFKSRDFSSPVWTSILRIAKANKETFEANQKTVEDLKTFENGTSSRI